MKSDSESSILNDEFDKSCFVKEGSKRLYNGEPKKLERAKAKV